MARILIAEDDVHMLRVLSMWLQRNGHQVQESRDGLQAQSTLMKTQVGGGDQPDFELIVSDINMPGMDGLSLVRWLRDDLGSDIPVLLLSSRCDQLELSTELRPYGVPVHSKPFSPSQLVVEIEKHLAPTCAGSEANNLRDES